MPQAMVVCRYRDGRLVKGHTDDFSPAKSIFHVHSKEEPRVVDVMVTDLKAVFFVKSLEGRKEYNEKKDFSLRPMVGIKIAVEFFDGEVIVGTAMGYAHNRTGFFMNPVDPESNNERIYVVSGAVEKVYAGSHAEEFLERFKHIK